MVPDVSTGSSTLGLINYLFGKGRRDEHTDPHTVAAWDMAGAPDPGRDPTATYAQLARRLDHHVDLRTRELGGKQPPQHVWHCPVRTAPGDRYLTDAEWAEVARRVVAATGIAPRETTRRVAGSQSGTPTTTSTSSRPPSAPTAAAPERTGTAGGPSGNAARSRPSSGCAA